MKVAYISIKRFEEMGQGIPRYVTMLYKSLEQLNKSNNLGFNIKKISYTGLPLIGEGLSLELKSFFSNFENFDILHNPIGFIPTYNIRNLKYVVTVHDTQQIYPNSLKNKLWKVLVVKRGLNYTLKNADFIITNSSQTKEEVIKLGFNKKKVAITNLGLDKKFIYLKSKQIIKNDKYIIGYLGAFGPNKNIRFILDTAKLLTRNKKIEFNVYGNKAYWYENFETDAAKNIIFKGFALEEKIIETYDSFDVFVFPSLYEGFGLPILEAQARGLPVIIYKYGKIPKEVRKYCFEAESLEHMAQIIENLKENGYNEKLRKEAMEYARSFTWEKCARETLEVYKKC